MEVAQTESLHICANFVNRALLDGANEVDMPTCTDFALLCKVMAKLLVDAQHNEAKIEQIWPLDERRRLFDTRLKSWSGVVASKSGSLTPTTHASTQLPSPEG